MIDYVLVLRYPVGRPDLDDAADRLLYLSGARGSTIEDEGSEMIVSLYFDSEGERAEARRSADATPGIAIVEEDRPRRDWLELYRQSLEAIPIGSRFIVAPDESLLEAADRIALVIPQERAFGTGGHASTAMCLELLESVELDGRIALDVGTGSGILAIGMARLGAKKVFAFDNDFETFGVVAKNLERNRVAPDRVAQFFGTFDAIGEHRVNVIAMNIIAEVIVGLLPTAHRFLEDGGALVVSGVIEERIRDVVEAARSAGFTLEDERRQGEWWGGRFRS